MGIALTTHRVGGPSARSLFFQPDLSDVRPRPVLGGS
jgi:hypothetical protein